MQRLTLFIFIFLSGFNSFSLAQQISIVKVAEVKQQMIPQYYSAPGYTAALNNIEISSKQTGFISKIFVEAGDIVDKGQLLVIIDETVNKQLIVQVKKEVEIARITVADAKKDVANFERLRKGQSVSEEKLRKSRLLLAQSQSILLKAKAKLVEIQATSPYLRLVSPDKARVIKRLADRGDLAVAGKELIHLQVLKPLLFETSIPVQWVNKVKKGQAIDIKFTINNDVKEIVAHITQIVTRADQTTQLCTIKLELPSSLDIPTGLFGKANFIVKQQKLLTIPEQAIVKRVGITGVFRVENKRVKNKKVIFNPIEIGRRYQQQRVILSGLRANEHVVISPSASLKEGMTINYEF